MATIEPYVLADGKTKRYRCGTGRPTSGAPTRAASPG